MGNSEANCRQVLTQLFVYIDGEAGEGDCASIEAHLQRCAPCLDQVEFERELKLFVRKSCGEGPPTELARKLRDRLAEMLDEPGGSPESSI